MIWSKMKQQLESFTCPELIGRVEYINTSYRYRNDKPGRCYITVDKKQVFNMKDASHGITWYKTKEEIMKDGMLEVLVSPEELEEVRKSSNNTIPEDRLEVIVKKRKSSEYAERIITASGILCRADFYEAAETYLTTPIERSLDSDDILLNVFALVDRRLGKKRILGLENKMKLKHPIVMYFYLLRKGTL